MQAIERDSGLALLGKAPGWGQLIKPRARKNAELFL
jgi:hypothetical protein